MENKISIIFGKPLYGWLPVEFKHKEFVLNFDASNVLTDCIGDLKDIINESNDNFIKRATFWLEAPAYFFDFEKIDEIYKLTIIETNDLFDKKEEEKVLTIITGNKKEIIAPIAIALKDFALFKF